MGFLSIRRALIIALHTVVAVHSGLTAYDDGFATAVTLRSCNARPEVIGSVHSLRTFNGPAYISGSALQWQVSDARRRLAIS